MTDRDTSWEEFVKVNKIKGIPVERSVRARGNPNEIEIKCAAFGYINGYHNAEDEAWETVKQLYERITSDKVDPEVARCWDRINYYQKKLNEYLDNKENEKYGDALDFDRGL